MTVNDTPMPNRAEATHQRSFLARSALLAGGAATGLVASALAGFGLVGLMFPNAGLPGTGGAPLTAAAYMPVSVTVMPETRMARIEPTPVPAAVAPASLSETANAPAPTVPAPTMPTLTVPDLPVDRQVAAFEPPAKAAPVTPHPAAASSVATLDDRSAAPASAPAQAPKTGPVIATKSAAPADPGTAGIDTSGYGPRIAALPTATAPAPTAPTAPTATGPEAFAMLADDDATARAGAGLFTDRAGPSNTPAETAAETAVETPAVTAPARPARRPEGFADQVAAIAAPLASAAPASSIRPAPRPDVQLAAASAPAATPATARTEIAAPTNVVEVAARQGSGGFLSGGSSDCGRSLARAIPLRRGGATGSAFFGGLSNVSGPDRDARAIAELARGNMPSFLRELQPVTFKGQDARGANVEITICVTPDYLALGSDKDYVRVPLGLPAAARIAGAFDMTLPTPRMVDAIYAQAGVKLSPAPMTPGSQMSTTGYFVTHNATIEGQLQGRRGLVGGHKKDVVMASRMASAPGRVAIYGWHQKGGAPIQPVSTVHGANYADYSHGIRLVSKTAYLNGKAVSLDDLLASSRYAYLLNTDGPMPGPVIRTASN